MCNLMCCLLDDYFDLDLFDECVCDVLGYMCLDEIIIC